MENTNKSYINLSWLIYVVIGAIGFILVRTLFNELNIAVVYDLDMNIYVYDVLILLYGFLSAGLVYSFGKFIASKLCGYELVYWNIYLIGFKKENNKIKAYFGGKQEFSCRVLMAPKKDNVKVTMPLLSGTIASVLAFGITYALIFGLNASPTIKFFFLVSSLFYVFVILLNLVPCRMDTLNDGFALFLLRDKSKVSVYLNNLKNVQALHDSSKEVLFLDHKVENHPIVLEAQVYNYYHLLEINQLEEALEVAKATYPFRKNIINEELMRAVVIGNVYAMCVKQQNDELKEYYSKIDVNEKHIFNESKNLESIKTALYIFAFIDEDREGYAKVINDTAKAKSNYRYPRLIEAEERMIKETIQVVQLHKSEFNENQENQSL